MPAKDRRPIADPRTDLHGLGLLDFIPKVSNRIYPPYHFAQIVDALEHAYGGDLRICFAAPRQHGKTTLIKHAFPWLHMKHQHARIFYATYAQEYSEIQSRDVRRMYIECGIHLRDDHNTLKGWTLEAGGDFTASSVEGRANGLGSDILVIDDPFKGPEEAYNKARRDQVYEWALQVVLPMLQPKASMFVIASRWDEDDLSGRMIEKQGFQEVRIPAIDENGNALCPDGPDPDKPRTLEFLLGLRDGRLMPDGSRKGGIGRAAFSALFQGVPEPAETNLFRGVPMRFTKKPDAMRLVIGIDLGFSKRGDHSAIVVMGEDSNKDRYVLRVERQQKRIGQVRDMLLAIKHEFPGVPMTTYASGPELGTYDLLIEDELFVECVPARVNKYLRSQQTAEGWGRGQIKIPALASWDLAGFIKRVRSFTGEDGLEDDEVDAMVSAFDYLDATALGAEPIFGGTRCM